MLYILSQTWSTYSSQAHDCILLRSRTIFQSDFDGSLRTIVFKLVILNISFLVQYFRDLLFKVGRRYLDNSMRSLATPELGVQSYELIFRIKTTVVILPAGLSDSRNFARGGHFPESNPVDTELSHVAFWTTC